MHLKNSSGQTDINCPDNEYGIGSVGEERNIRLFAPNADGVAVLGDFNGWDIKAHPLSPKGDGWWQTYVSNEAFPEGTRYKFAVTNGEKTVLKRDPYAFSSEPEEGGASVFCDVDGFPWTDGSWLKHRKKYRNDVEGESYAQPINVYQIDLASWKRKNDGGYLSYRELADDLASYIRQMGYTHVEIIRLMEYIADGGAARRTVSYFAPTSRFGSPYDLAYFVNRLHESGIGVIVEWSPTRFAETEGGLCRFDGTPLYEYDESVGEDGMRRFDLSRTEVRDFLTAAAEFWLDKYHIDGLSADTVYPTDAFGIYESQESSKVADYVGFFSALNTKIKEKYPYALMIAEGGFPDIPLIGEPKNGGLAFSLKRNNDWARDFLDYVKVDPIFRKYYHGKLTYPMVYSFCERFILSVSKELFEGSSTLMESQFGDTADKLRGMRIWGMYAMAYPGKKLSFMGSEFGQRSSWDPDGQLDWHKNGTEEHGKLLMFTAALNEFYLKNSVLWEDDFSWDGFRWILTGEAERNLIAFERRNAKGERLICAVNFSGVDVNDYLLTLSDDVPYPDVENGARPSEQEWRVVFSGDEFLNANTVRLNGGRLKISLPARSAIYLVPVRNEIFGI